MKSESNIESITSPSIFPESTFSPYVLAHLEQQILYAQVLCEGLNDKLDHALDSVDYPSHNARDMARLLQKMVRAVDLQLEMDLQPELEEHKQKWKEEKKVNEGNIVRIDLKIAGAIAFISQLTRLIELIDGSNAENNPWGVTSSIDNLCRRLHPRARVIIRPRWLYNYTYSPSSISLEQMIQTVARFSKDLYRALTNIVVADEHYFSFAYPPTASENVLQMAIWSHEIAHFIKRIIITKQEAGGQPASGYLSFRFHVKVDLQKVRSLVRNQTISGGEIPDPDDPDEINNMLKRISDPISEKFRNWENELFADMFSIRLFGPAALFAFFEFAYPVERFDPAVHIPYPPFKTRLRLMIDELKRWESSHPEWLNDFPENIKVEYRNYVEYLATYAAGQEMVPGPLRSSPQGDLKEIEAVRQQAFEENLGDFTDELRYRVDQIVSDNEYCFLHAVDMHHIVPAIGDLTRQFPPSIPIVTNDGQFVEEVAGKSLALLINAGWLYWLSQPYRRIEGNSDGPSDKRLQRSDSFRGLNKLLLKSISDVEATRWYSHRKEFGNRTNGSNARKVPKIEFAQLNGSPNEMSGVLGQDELLNRLEVPSSDKERLILRPLLDKESQVGTCSLDVRLSNEFIVTKRPVLPELDPTDLEVGSSTMQFYQKLYLPFGKPFILHPGQFVLSSTLEYVRMPSDLMGLVVGRASLAHLGLVIGNAYKVIPTFRGCITLELTNLGDAPIRLYPFMRIAQILVHAMKPWPIKGVTYAGT